MFDNLTFDAIIKLSKDCLIIKLLEGVFMKLRLDITGIDCPHCAKELEQLMADLDCIEDVAINFPLSKLIVVVDDDADEDEILAQLLSVAKKFEDNIAISFSD